MDNFKSSDWGDSQSAEMDYIRSWNNVLAKYFDAFIHRAVLALRDSVKNIETGVIRSGEFMLLLINPAIPNTIARYAC